MQMIKYFSLISILCSAIYAGNLMAKRYENRVRELIQLKLSINVLKTKIKFTQTPLKDIFEQIFQTSEKNEIRQFWNYIVKELNQRKPLEEAWKSAIKQTETSLTREDINILLDMGKMLGKTDIDGQVSNLEIASVFIDNQIEKAEKEKQKNSKLCKTMGIVGGLALIIILI